MKKEGEGRGEGRGEGGRERGREGMKEGGRSERKGREECRALSCGRWGDKTDGLATDRTKIILNSLRQSNSARNL